MNGDLPILPFPEILNTVKLLTPPTIPVYLVGGTVRDLLLQRPVHDLDFVVPENSLEIARNVANTLQGAYYPLDTQRGTARAIHFLPSGERLVLDFALFQGEDLDADLRLRDLTINAIAIDVRSPTTLIDPLRGANDLRIGQLRPCTEHAFLDDPLRILRAVRLAVKFNFRLMSETKELIRQAVPKLPVVSSERIRDELFQVLETSQPATAVQILDALGILPHIFPELLPLRGILPSPPHHEDVWDHTLSVTRSLNQVVETLAQSFNPDQSNWSTGLISLHLGRFRQQLAEHLASPINPGRSHRALLLLAALYHDAGKPQTLVQDSQGRIRFFGHEQVGAQMMQGRGEELRLNNEEIERLTTIVKNHMRPLLMAQADTPPSRRAIYHFFKDCGTGGIDCSLLSLADTMATYGPALPQELWIRQLAVVRNLLEAWWEKPTQMVTPSPLLNGDQLIEAFQLQPGSRLGQLLADLREAQAAGEISDKETALEFARAWLENPK